MFFNKKKKQKIDPKVRFQNRQFNQKLHQARTFKRTAKPIPEGKLDKFLDNIGLGSRFAQALVVISFLGIIYIVYIPNFLTVQNFVVEGLSEEQSKAALEKVQETMGSAKFYDPQNNLLFLSKSRIANASLELIGVNRVEKITKNFSNKTLYITLVPKQERFLVRDSQGVFDVYEDGTLKGAAGLPRDAWESVVTPHMIKIDVVGKMKIDSAGKVMILSNEYANYLNILKKELQGIPGSPLAYIKFAKSVAPIKPDETFIEDPLAEAIKDDLETGEEEPVLVDPKELEIVELAPEEIALPLPSEELSVVLQKGTDPNRTFRVIIGSEEPAREAVLRLNLLLSQTAPDRYNNLNYIDLRIKSRAFVCLNNAPCAE